MRIAITYEDGEIFQHFGHTERFKLYDVENGSIVNTQVVDSNGSGHGLLAGFLKGTLITALCVAVVGSVVFAIIGLPSPIDNALRRLASASGPRIMPTTTGAVGKSKRRMITPSTPMA